MAEQLASLMIRATKRRTYHPAEALAELGKDCVPECRIDVELAKFKRRTPVGHVPETNALPHICGRMCLNPRSARASGG